MYDDKNTQKQAQESLQFHDQQPEILDSSSQFVNDYEEFFRDLPHPKKRQQLLSMIGKRGEIDYEQGQFQKSMTIKIINHSLNYEIIECEAILGFFHVPIVLLNVQNKSIAHSLLHSSSTTSTIFTYNSVQEDAVIKCLPIQSKEMSFQFSSAVKEYCLYKIASCLDVGPKMSSLFGFDLIVYDECIEFAMQKCVPLKEIKNNDVLLLKQKLRKLHALNIIHMDIKPDNICFSPGLNEAVFIDYGLSEINAQVRGMKTMTCFSGSLRFCGPQMMHAYHESSGYVDLYYNDVHCFLKTLKCYQEESSNKIVQKPFHYDEDEQIQFQHNDDEKDVMFYNLTTNPGKIVESFFKIYTKFNIYQGKFDKKDHKNMVFLTKYSNYFLNFLNTLPYSKYFEDIYDYLLKNIPQYKRQVLSSYTRQNMIFQAPVPSKAKDQTHTEESASNFSHRQRFFSSNLVHKNDLHISNKKSKENIKAFLLNLQLIRKTNKNNYFSSFITFVDIRAANSTSLQKQQVSDVMINLLNLSSTKEYLIFNSLTICLKYLLQFYTKNIEYQCQKIIPNILLNLIILEVLSILQLKIVIENITKINIDIIRMAKLLFRCSQAIDWIIFRSISRYKYTKLAFCIYSVFKQKLKTMLCNCSEPNQLITAIFKILTADRGLYFTQQSFKAIISKIQSDKYYIEESFLIEFQIYYCSLQLDIYHLQENQAEMMRLIEYIDHLQKKLNLGEVRFDHYHFRIFRLLKIINSHQLLCNLHAKFEACLQHPELITKYTVHYNFIELQYALKKRPISDFCQQAMNSMSLIQFLTNKEIIMNVLNLLYIEDVRFKTLANKYRTQIFTMLKKIISYENIKKIQFPENNLINQIIEFYQNYYYLLLVFQQLYRGEEQTITQLVEFQCRLSSYWLNIYCPSCKLSSYMFLILIRGFILESAGRYEQSLVTYMDLIQEANKTQNSKLSKMTLLTKALRLCVLHQWLDKKYCCFELFYTQIMKNKQEYHLISSNECYNTFNFINRYIAIVKRDIPGYAELHRKLTLFIRQFSSKEHIQRYNTQTSAFLERYKRIIPQLIEILKNNQDNKQIQGQYIILLYSICLKYKQQPSPRSLNLLKQICENLNRIALSSRSIILENIYSYIISQLIKMKERTDYRTFELRLQPYQIHQIKRILAQKMKTYIKIKSIFSFSNFFSKINTKRLKRSNFEAKHIAIRHTTLITKLKTYYKFSLPEST